jgi:putative transposase
MARKKRNYIAGMLYHILHRGHNDGLCFFSEDCYRYYLNCLADALRIYRASLHAYVILHNQVNLLLTPDDPDTIPRLMKMVGGRYTLFVNRIFHRSGTLWDGRYRSCIVCAESNLLQCHIYIESLPVARNLVTHPGEYQWSSYCRNAFADTRGLLTPHPVYHALGNDMSTRCAAYRELFLHTSRDDLQQIQGLLIKGQLLGGAEFRRRVEEQLGCSLGQARCGRPRKAILAAPRLTGIPAAEFSPNTGSV